MYKSIHIQNFRCFEDTKIEGFEQINLIGGQNNAGKTALLEALYLGGEPFESTIGVLLKYRNEYDLIYDNPENNPFKNFYTNQNQEKNIEIFLNKKDNKTSKVEINSFGTIENESDSIIDRAVLDILCFSSDIDLPFNSEITTLKKGEKRTVLPLHIFDGVTFIPSFSTITNLNKMYEMVILENKKDYLIKMFQLIDKEIIGVELINNKLLLESKNKKLLPINVYGDAMSKLCQIVLLILSKQCRILLIDEIENGIHHTNQQKFWTMLFNLAAAFDIQIFATSHSAEMIKAFQEVASAHTIKGGYFELTRHAKTNKLLGIKTQLDTLSSKVERKMNFRGE